MKFRFIYQEQRWYGLEVLCRAMKVTRGGYWAWMKRRPSARKLCDSLLLSDIKKIYADGRGTYGSPRVHAALSKAGVGCGKKRVERLMQENGLKAKQKKRYKPQTTNSRHSLPIAPNVLNRQFQRQQPNEVWTADTTFIATKEGWLYLAALLDLYSRSVVGWAMGERNDRGLVLRALHMAQQRRRPPRGLIHHSDRGSTYASCDYQSALLQYGMVASMSRKGNCYDNAPAESWFHTLKVELVQGRVFATRQEAMSAIFEYVEVFYNRQRICSAIGGVSPAQFEAGRVS